MSENDIKKLPFDFSFKRQLSGGELGIRTPGGFHLNGFQDRRFRPLSQLSIFICHKKQEIFLFLMVTCKV